MFDYNSIWSMINHYNEMKWHQFKRFHPWLNHNNLTCTASKCLRVFTNKENSDKFHLIIPHNLSLKADPTRVVEFLTRVSAIDDQAICYLEMEGLIFFSYKTLVKMIDQSMPFLIKINAPLDYWKLVNWIEDNTIGHSIRLNAHDFCFSHHEDATLFRLKWA